VANASSTISNVPHAIERNGNPANASRQRTSLRVGLFYHVTSVLNRDSIHAHGLDWTRTGAARGIAGSRRAEQEGCFLAHDYENDWFVRMNNTGNAVDVWEISGVETAALVQSSEGYSYFPGIIPQSRLRLLRRDIPPQDTQGS
jgi:hypothetical protein